MENKYFYNDITIIKLLATFFITWFHFKDVVPEQFAPFFIGGAIGNSMFFYASGYLLSFKKDRYYGQWLVNKYLRIMPSIWVFTVGCFFVTNSSGMNFQWTMLFYPTKFWFVNCILCYFLIVYLVRRWLTKNGLVILGTIVFCFYVVNYVLYVDHTKVVMDEGGYKCWFFFFFFFLWGYYDKSHKNVCSGKIGSVIWFVFAIGIFFLYKKVGCRNQTLVYLQFIFIPLCLYVVVYFSRYVANYIVSKDLPENVKRLFSFVSDLTLDIYIVQIAIINSLGANLPFPISIVILSVTIFIVAFFNNYLAKLLRKGIVRRL